MVTSRDCGHGAIYSRPVVLTCSDRFAATSSSRKLWEIIDPVRLNALLFLEEEVSRTCSGAELEKASQFRG